MHPLKVLISALGFIFMASIAVFYIVRPQNPPLQLNVSNFQMDGCVDEKQREIYSICTNYKELLTQSRQLARTHGKLLVIKWGYYECPWCLALHRLLNEDYQDTNSVLRSFYRDNFETVEISVRSESGKQLMQQFKVSQRTEGVPFLMVLNPLGDDYCQDQAYSIDTANLEEKYEQIDLMHSSEKVLDKLKLAREELLQQNGHSACEI